MPPTLHSGEGRRDCRFNPHLTTVEGKGRGGKKSLWILPTPKKDIVLTSVRKKSSGCSFPKKKRTVFFPKPRKKD